MIRIHDLHKQHGGREVLRGIDATVEEGTTIAIVGPSGGGKSTLLRCLNYLEPFDRGKVEIAGFTLTPRMGRGGRERDLLRRLRASVGMVFQQFHLFPHLTALENVTIGPVVLKQMNRDEAVRVGRELLARVGLGDRAGAYPSELSGGQQQRVAIARALAQKPRALLFDEPTSALDPEMRDDVLEVMQDLSREGRTMLVVTHEMQFAHDVAHRVWVMDGGTIVEDGPPTQVVDHPRSAVAKEFFRRVAAARRSS